MSSPTQNSNETHLFDLLRETEIIGKIGGWEFDVLTQKQKWTRGIFDILEFDSTEEAPDVPEGMGYIDEAFQPMVLDAMKHAIENGAPYHEEWKVITQKGNYRWVCSIGKANQVNGKTISLSGSFQDITDQKAKEKIVQDLLTKQNSILNAVPDLLFEVDITGKIYDFHSQSSKLLSVPKNEMIGKCFSELIELEAAEVCSSAIQEANEIGISIGKQYSLVFEESIYWFEISVAAFEVDNQIKKHFIFLARDITERKLAENALNDKMKEMNRLLQLTIGRERTMIELKKEINELLINGGKSAKYQHLE